MCIEDRMIFYQNSCMAPNKKGRKLSCSIIKDWDCFLVNLLHACLIIYNRFVLNSEVDTDF